MGRRSNRTAIPGQLTFFGCADQPGKQPRRGRFYTADELDTFARSERLASTIRPHWLDEDERLCPGCSKVISRQARNCGRRWCDAVRPTWGRTVGEIVRAALTAYCDLYAGEG